MISSKPSRSKTPTRRWPAFSTHLGMSILEPRSDDRTQMTVPTADSRMARMSSISGPGQKLPRASMVRSIAGDCWSVSMVMTFTPFRSHALDEQAGGVRLGHQLEDRCSAGGLAQAVDHVL